MNKGLNVKDNLFIYISFDFVEYFALNSKWENKINLDPKSKLDLLTQSTIPNHIMISQGLALP